MNDGIRVRIPKLRRTLSTQLMAAPSPCAGRSTFTPRLVSRCMDLAGVPASLERSSA
jgi:hypothetical protein